MTPLHIDGLIRIKNAYNAGLASLTMPSNTFLEKMIKLLKDEKRIVDYSLSDGPKKSITVSLSYQAGTPAFSEVKLYSKPGRKVYTGYSDLKSVKGGKGLSIISTPQGLMTGSTAIKNKLGGELIVAIW